VQCGGSNGNMVVVIVVVVVVVVEVVAHTVVAAVATVTNEYREPRGHVTLTSKHYDKSPVKPSFQHLPTGLTASKHSAADAAATSSLPSLTPFRHYYTMMLV